MKLSIVPNDEFVKTLGYITTLCGYPAISQDKLNVLISFLRDSHGHNTTEELIDSYRALALGRLEEKMDQHRSLTGMSASRVLQSYLRIKMREKDSVVQPPPDRSFLTDENKALIKELTGRDLLFNDEVMDNEYKLLMDHWIERQRQNYYDLKRADLLTATSFIYLEKNGTLRVKDDNFQKFINNSYITICSWKEAEGRGQQIKNDEDKELSRAKSERISRMQSPAFGKPIEDAIKCAAMAIYFDSIQQIKEQ